MTFPERPYAAIVGVVMLTVFFVLPAFLVAALALQISEDIPIRADQYGLAAGAYFAVSAIAAAPLGALAQRMGPVRSLFAAGLLSCACYLGIGLTAHTWEEVLVFLAALGLTNALGQASGNEAISNLVRTRRAFAFGLKQAAIPASTLLAGLAVSVVGPLIGWRATFAWTGVAAIGCTLLLSLAWPRTSPGASPRPITPRHAQPIRMPPLLLLSAGGLFGAAAANAYGVFIVEAAVTNGWREVAAGHLLVIVSLLGIAVRVGAGWVADRRRAEGLGVVAAMMAVGAVGFGVLVVASARPVSFVLASAMIFGGGWGWPGLFHYSVVHENIVAPAKATGIVQSGVWAGGLLGPATFGFVIAAGFHQAAYLAAAGCFAMAAVLVVASGVSYSRGAQLRREIAGSG